MLPNPLHPAVVHFPIVIATLLPIVAVASLILILRGRGARPLWMVVVLLGGSLAVSSWASVRTGEAQEEAVEEFVGDGAIHDHEESAEAFLLLSVLAFGVLTAGLLKGKPGQAARLVGAAMTILVLVFGVKVGHSGGELVYVHGAAQAYATGNGEPSDDTDSHSDDRDDDRGES
jgi:phosphatidylglycerophosphate synthase